MKLPTFAHTVFLAALFSILALSLTGCTADPTPAPVSFTPTPEIQQSATETQNVPRVDGAVADGYTHTDAIADT